MARMLDAGNALWVVTDSAGVGWRGALHGEMVEGAREGVEEQK